MTEAATEMSTDHQQQSGNPEPASLLGGWLTRPQVADEVGVSIDTLQRWETRRIGPPCVRIGRKVLYRAEAFREWLISRERGPVAAKGARAGGAQ
jgi:predicted DNA-binding transcriptional regulator AlpA